MHVTSMAAPATLALVGPGLFAMLWQRRMARMPLMQAA